MTDGREGIDRRPFAIHGLIVDPARNVVSEASGRAIHVEPRAIDVLCVLAARAGEVVSRDSLIERVWRGAYGADPNLSKAVSQLRKVLHDERTNPRFVETVAKRGYRLVAPVEWLSAPKGHSTGEPVVTVPEALNRSGMPKRITGAVAASLAVLLAMGTVLWELGKVAGPEERAVAVIPFVSLSDGRENEYFVDGLTEELINALARGSELDVAARTSSFYFKGKDVNLDEIAEALGVGYVLEGSVRRTGERLRITAQLIDAEDGFPLWSESFDREPSDIFMVQEEIAEQVANALRVTLVGQGREAPLERGTEDAEAHRLYLVAKSQLRQGRPYGSLASLDGAHLVSARRNLQKAVARDPEFGAAWAALSRAYLFLGTTRSTGSKEALTRGQAHRLAGSALEKAKQFAPDLPETLLAEAEFLFDALSVQISDTVRPIQMIEAYEEALTAAPQNAEILRSYARVLSLRGDLDRALALYDRALARDPLSDIRLRRAETLLKAGRLAAARDDFLRTGELYPDSSWKSGMARIEFQRQHLHHGLVWAADSPGDLLAPFAWRSLGDTESALEGLERYREAGGELEVLVAGVAHAFERDYRQFFVHAGSGSALNAARPTAWDKRFTKWQQLQMRYIGAAYLRDWERAKTVWEEMKAFDPAIAERIEAAANAAGDNPRNAEPRTGQKTELVRSLASVSYMLERVGEGAKAERLWRQVEAVLDSIEPRTPIERLEQLHLQMLVHSGQGRTEAALDAFERLYEAGWRWTMGFPPAIQIATAYHGDIFWFEDTPLLDPIRDETRFNAVVEKVKTANAAMLAELDAGLNLEDIMDEEVAE